MVYWTFVRPILPAAIPGRIQASSVSGAESAMIRNTTIQGCLRSTTSHFPLWSGQRGLNPQHSAWKADAPPFELCPRIISVCPVRQASFRFAMKKTPWHSLICFFFKLKKPGLFS